MCNCNLPQALAEDLIDFTAAARPVLDGACVMCQDRPGHPRTNLCHGCEIQLVLMAERAGEPEYPTQAQYRSAGDVAANAPEEYDMIDLGLYGQWFDEDGRAA